MPFPHALHKLPNYGRDLGGAVILFSETFSIKNHAKTMQKKLCKIKCALDLVIRSDH